MHKEDPYADYEYENWTDDTTQHGDIDAFVIKQKIVQLLEYYGINPIRDISVSMSYRESCDMDKTRELGLAGHFYEIEFSRRVHNIKDERYHRANQLLDHLVETWGEKLETRSFTHPEQGWTSRTCSLRSNPEEIYDLLVEAAEKLPKRFADRSQGYTGSGFSPLG